MRQLGSQRSVSGHYDEYSPTFEIALTCASACGPGRESSPLERPIPREVVESGSWCGQRLIGA